MTGRYLLGIDSGGTVTKAVLYDLAGHEVAVVGLDATTGTRGRADVRIRVDGKEVSLPELKALQAGNAVPVKVDVRGAKELRPELYQGMEPCRVAASALG